MFNPSASVGRFRRGLRAQDPNEPMDFEELMAFFRKAVEYYEDKRKLWFYGSPGG